MIGTPRAAHHGRQHGQAMVLFVIFLVMILGSLALVLNSGLLRHSDQELWNALDSGALAGAQSLPADPTQAENDARRFALLNHPGLSASSLSVSFRCLVGDRNGDGRPDSADVPAVCDPGTGATWTCADGKCVAVCTPGGTRTCNTVVVNGTVDTEYELEGVTGVDGATTTFESAACSGLCGADPTLPLDIGIVLDRTSSMSDADLTNVKNGALAMLQSLEPSQQHVGLAVLGPSQTSANCSGTGNARGMADNDGGGIWVTVPYPSSHGLANNYLNNDGSLNANAQLVRTIQCLDHSSVGTNLGDPLLEMANTLTSRGRSGVSKGIILMTDGAANQPDSRSCKYANDRATTVKNMGIDLYTIGFGVAGDRCVDADGTYANALASTLLADMASGPTVDNGCSDAENADGDHYFCEPRSDSLTTVFRLAAAALVAGSAKLVHLPG